jgi:thiol-disulfide isomerase/thioredoxin
VSPGKIVGGIVAFLAFVGALMALVWFTTPHSTTKPRPSTNLGAEAEAQQQPEETAQPEQQKPFPLPALFVFRDDKDPKPIALAGPRARPIMLHLWASWCGPCRAELPSLMAYAKTGPADLVAVSVDDHYEDVVKFFGGKIPPEVVWDKTITLEKTLGTENIPTTFLVDTKGMVVDRFDGAQNWENPELKRAVKDELK